MSINEIAKPFYLSPHYLGDIFKQTTGMSLKKYHNSLRMTKAAILLTKSILNVSEVAANIGFGGIHYFSRKFKEFYGVSPMHYRKIKQLARKVPAL